MAAPGGSGPVEPFPARVGDDPAAQEEYDKLRRRVLWTLPYGLYALGSRATVDGVDTRNMMTLNWVTQVSFAPKLLGIGVEQAALTHRLVADGGVFSLCTVDREDRAIVRKFTKPVEADLDAMTLNGFAFHDGATGAPVLDQSPAFLECEVRHSLDLGGHTFFVGEVVDCAFQADEATPVLRMEDTRMNYGG
jgi:flavin reductase (DIM6/NTAB) family NADH-FMN oxidoreductase RutF